VLKSFYWKVTDKITRTTFIQKVASEYCSPIKKLKLRKKYSMKKLSNIVLLVVTLFALGTTNTFAQKKPVRKKPVLTKKPVAPKPPVVAATPKAPKQYMVEQGQRVRVRMESTITSKTAKAGDTFTVRTAEPVYSNTGVVVIPTGSTLIGRIDTVTAAAKGGKPGTIDVSFIEVKLPNGLKKEMNGSLTELDTDKAKSDAEGTASGDKMKYRKPIFVGGGATGGAILGGVIGGGTGAVVGGIIGGVGGLITETQTKGEEATVKAGTEFGVILNQKLMLPKFIEVETDDK
jgi:hypothetical protein